VNFQFPGFGTLLPYLLCFLPAFFGITSYLEKNGCGRFAMMPVRAVPTLLKVKNAPAK
jgi:hypothetical protein